MDHLARLWRDHCKARPPEARLKDCDYIRFLFHLKKENSVHTALLKSLSFSHAVIIFLCIPFLSSFYNTAHSPLQDHWITQALPLATKDPKLVAYNDHFILLTDLVGLGLNRAWRGLLVCAPRCLESQLGLQLEII